jgi:hypothetical protein
MWPLALLHWLWPPPGATAGQRSCWPASWPRSRWAGRRCGGRAGRVGGLDACPRDDHELGHTLLARRSIPATTGIESIALAVDATTAYRASTYSGWGPFRADFLPPPPGERLEVRVWSPGSGTVSVYSAELARWAARAASQQPGHELDGGTDGKLEDGHSPR